MAELGQTADPRALVPGDPEGVRTTQAAMSRLGGALLRTGDGLARVDTADWTGEAADAFRSVFDGVPAQWTGSGEAFLDAADALTDHGEVLAWAQGEAATAVVEWEQAQAGTMGARNDHARALDAETANAAAEGRPPAEVPFADPGEPGRAAAVDRLRRARAEVRASGDQAAVVVGRARDLAPPSPSLAARIGGFLGDLGSGAWNEIRATGQFLWQIDPARLLVEPAEAVQGWKDLGTGVVDAATHPQQAIDGALNPQEFRTNPTRWAGEMITSAGLSGLGGTGIARRVHRASEAGHIADALEGPDRPDGAPPPPPALGRHNGRTAAEHVANRGADIGWPSSSRKAWVREVDDPALVRRIYEELSQGGQVVDDPSFGGERVVFPDGTRVQYREESGSTGRGVTQIQAPGQKSVKIHLPKGGA